MKMRFKYLVVFLLSFIILTSSINAYYDKIDNTTDKIYDYGDFLTLEEKTELKKSIDDYIEKYNLDLVIVTKKDYNFNLMQDYAQDFYDYNNFGIGNTHDGIILFYNVDSEGPAVWISTTGEAMRMYDDARIDSMTRSMSFVKSSGHYAMIKKFVERADFYANSGIPESNKDTYIDENGDMHVIRRYPWFAIGIISLIVSGIVTMVLVHKNKTVKKAVDAKQYLDATSVKMTGKSDKFVGTHTTKTYIPPNDSGGHSGSHRVGGSSISRGSSGRSHGGGGRRL